MRGFSLRFFDMDRIDYCEYVRIAKKLQGMYNIGFQEALTLMLIKGLESVDENVGGILDGMSDEEDLD